jgi:hypothetical protein
MTRPFTIQLSEKDIKEFQELYKRDYKMSLSFEDAKEQAEHLLDFMAFIFK